MRLANIPSDIKRTARELKIPVLQHHIYVNGRHKHVTISKKCVRKAGLTEKYSVQIVVLGEVRPYMIFSYDPLCENRPHLLFLPSSCEIHSPYVTRALQRIGGGNEICRLRFHGKPVFLKGKDGTVVTVVWRISTSPVRDIASTVQNIQNRNM